MMETIRRSKEKPVYVEAFEHVFPGNKFELARSGSLLEYFIFFVTAVTDYNYVTSVMVPEPNVGNLVHRIPFEKPSQLMINYYLGKTSKLIYSRPPISLSGILEDGEILGGSIATRSSIPSLKSGGSIIWVTGVMNQERQPRALIAHRFFKKPSPFPNRVMPQRLNQAPA